MKYQFKLTFITAVLFISATFAGAQTLPDNAYLLKRISGNKITGVWRLDKKESDNTIAKLGEALRKQQSGADDEISTSPAISVSIMPPESLVLAGDSEKMTINEGFADFVSTRTVSTDGNYHLRKIHDGAQSKVSAKQEAGTLTVEVISPRGNTLKQSYSLADDGNKLIVTLRFEDEDSTEMLTLRRVYNRSTLDLFDIGSRAAN